MRAWARNKNKSEASKITLKGNTSNRQSRVKMKKREVEVDKNFSKHHKLSPTKKCCADNILRVSRFFQYGESNYLDPSHRECDNWKHLIWNADSAAGPISPNFLLMIFMILFLFVDFLMNPEISHRSVASLIPLLSLCHPSNIISENIRH